ncbi:FecCD family ABC transporter permease [Hydrogenovibrio halophilus]|uniref:FecCD family ABC transporter permease n=1 Tax=Hydrogenovibrio halophilus TaxID=373391 RepID=UPI00036A098E|nr:iron ABC transporter permease [Hydrogenovibrio halophilus]
MNQPIGRPALLGLLWLTLVLCAIWALRQGVYSLSWAEWWQALHSPGATGVATQVVWELRLPRLLLAALVGAILGLCGAAMQGLFRNPLADPALIGVSSGAALASVMVIVLGSSLAFVPENAFWLRPLAGFLGGVAVTWFIYRFASRYGRTDIGVMLLAGVAVNAMAGAGMGLMSYLASDQALRQLTYWTLGSLSQADWAQVGLLLPVLIGALLGLMSYARALNLFLMGDRVVTHLGLSLPAMKRAVVLWTALGVGAAVSVSGVIGFVGLVAPHLVRLLIGPDHRWLLPASALMGACLVVVADTLARGLAAPAELPLGIIMAAVGGPFFLWLLWRHLRGGLLGGPHA